MMNDDDVKYSVGLFIQFDEDEDGNLQWGLQAHPHIEETIDTPIQELARQGAPLSVLGIRVLKETLHEGLIKHALDRAYNVLLRERLNAMQQAMMEAGTAPEERLSAEMDDGAVIH